MKVQRLVMAGNTQPAGRKSHLRLTGVTLKMPANPKNNGSFIAGLLGFDYTAGYLYTSTVLKSKQSWMHGLGHVRLGSV